MKKNIIFIFLLIGLFGTSKVSSQTNVGRINKNSLYDYYLNNSNSNTNIDSNYNGSININYGENDIWSGGIRVEINKFVYDFALGSTFNGYNNDINRPNNFSVIRTFIGKLGVGKKVTKDFIVGIDYQYTEYKQKNNSNSSGQILDTKHNFGMFFNYSLSNEIGLNFTTNTLIGNSVGISFNISLFE